MSEGDQIHVRIDRNGYGTARLGVWLAGERRKHSTSPCGNNPLANDLEGNGWIAFSADNDSARIGRIGQGYRCECFLRNKLLELALAFVGCNSTWTKQKTLHRSHDSLQEKPQPSQ
jgi:hypothetical protein